jgi:undecaprenyl diphosphate synthase
MVRAVQKIVDENKIGRKKVRVTPKMIKENLYTKDLPPVDMVIRTGGEPHLSNGFMMWEVADAELYFSDKFWPDFKKRELDEALSSYSQRRRRRGA